MAKQTTKKTAVKPAAKKTVKTVEKKVNTPCGCACHEHKHCGCCKGAFWKKLILFIAVFAIGFASAKMTHCKKHKMMPRPEFDNGCLVVKCPKMAKTQKRQKWPFSQKPQNWAFFGIPPKSQFSR